MIDQTVIEAIVALLALTAMEIVLGIDNIVFITIVTSKLPLEQQPKARKIGLMLALASRIILLFALSFILKLVEPIFTLDQFGIAVEWLHKEENHHVNEVSWRDLILLAGGLFLIGKSVKEIHEKMDHVEEEVKYSGTFANAMFQILILDVIFSLDSIVTAVGMVREELIWVMVTAIILSVIVMLIFAERVSRFVEDNPTLKMLALSFLILIGVMLFSEGIGQEMNKGYVYFAMAFALVVEFLNMRVRRKQGTKKGKTEPAAN